MHEWFKAKINWTKLKIKQWNDKKHIKWWKFKENIIRTDQSEETSRTSDEQQGNSPGSVWWKVYWILISGEVVLNGEKQVESLEE